jgi:hypothetical protein
MDSIFFFDRIEIEEKGGRNAIAEPYAMHKRCLYGCSILFVFFSSCFFIPYFSPILQDRRTVHA